MNHFDSNGWTSIHSAAFKGFNSSLEKLVNRNLDNLELRTTDELQSTPLLLAVMSGNVSTVELLLSFNAQIHARNFQGHGVVEISCLRKDVNMLKYFLTKAIDSGGDDDNDDDDELPIYTQLVDFFGSLEDDWSIRTAACLSIMIDGKEVQLPIPVEQFKQQLLEAGLITTIVRILKGPQGLECKRQSMILLQKIFHDPEVRNHFVKAEGIESIMPLLRPPSLPNVVLEAMKVLDELIKEPDGFSEKVYKSGVITETNRILQWATLPVEPMNPNDYEALHRNKTGNKEEAPETDKAKLKENQILKDTWSKSTLLTTIIRFIGNLSAANQVYQSSIGREPHYLERITKLFHPPCRSRTLLFTLTNTVGKLAHDNLTNQNVFHTLDTEDFIVPLIRSKDSNLQLRAVETMYYFSKGNKNYSSHMMMKEVHKPIILMLRKAGRNVLINEKTSLTLWTLAGDTRIKKAEMANNIGVDKLIDFLQTSSLTLQLVGSEGIYVLSGGPMSQRDVIGRHNGIPPLVNLLNSEKKEIVISCVKSLRQLCIRIGYLPHVRNQQLVVMTRGLQTLVALMRYCDDERIQMEAAYTIACVTMRNRELMTELYANPKFNFIYILEKMYSNNDQVRLLAGAALAAFAYNNIDEQKQIAMCGGIRFACLQPFLDAPDPQDRIMCAFQMVVLARVIPDEELAKSTSAALKTLVTTLVTSDNPDVQELGCDCVARLCHTRAGIASGMLSLGIVDILCTLILSYIESVRGSASIAIEYLSHFPEARRNILRKCRRDPYLMKAVKFYNSNDKIDRDLVEGWRHYQKVGLPKIDETRPTLTARVELDLLQGLDVRQLTLYAQSDSAASMEASEFGDYDKVVLSSRQPLPPIQNNDDDIKLTDNQQEEDIVDDNEDNTRAHEDATVDARVDLYDAPVNEMKNSIFEETNLSLST